MSPVRGQWWGGGLRGALPSLLSGYHLPACLILRAETQTPAGCRPEGGWMFLNTRLSLFIHLCVFAVYTWRLLPGGRPHSLAGYTKLASIQHGNQQSQFVTVKSNIHLFFELLWLPRSAGLLCTLNSSSFLYEVQDIT